MMSVLKTLLILFFVAAQFAGVAQANEKIRIRTDKALYHAGEILWFRIDILDAPTHRPLPVSHVAYVELLDSNNAPVVQAKINVEDAWGQGSLELPLNMRAGTYLLRGYTNWLKNFNEKTYYQLQVPVSNLTQAAHAVALPNVALPVLAGTLQPQVAINSQSVGTRQKVTVNISVPAYNSEAPLLPATIAVFKLLPAQKFVDDVVQKSSPSEAMHNPQQIQHPPEYKGHFISGRVRTPDGRPAADVDCYLTVAGPVPGFYSARSDANGNFRFEVKDIYGDNQLIVQSTDTTCQIEIDDPFPSADLSWPGAPATLTKDTASLLDLAVSAQVRLVYAVGNDRAADSIEADTLPFFGLPEYTYKMNDYTRFSSVEEILREYVRPVQITRRDGALTPVVFDQARHRQFLRPPLVLLDYVPLLNVQTLMQFEPDSIARIDVVDKLYYLGPQSFDGVVSVHTRSRSLSNVPLPRNAAIVPYSGLQIVHQFSAPEYFNEEQRTSRRPDFRNLLYWSPALSLEQPRTVEFYTSDLKGEYAVVVQVTDAAGNQGNKVVRFRVE